MLGRPPAGHRTAGAADGRGWASRQTGRALSDGQRTTTCRPRPAAARESPIHWNPLYETWVMTRYDDVVWCLRHPELFSSEIFLRDARPPFPPILHTDHAL